MSVPGANPFGGEVVGKIFVLKIIRVGNPGPREISTERVHDWQQNIQVQPVRDSPDRISASVDMLNGDTIPKLQKIIAEFARSGPRWNPAGQNFARAAPKQSDARIRDDEMEIGRLRA